MWSDGTGGEEPSPADSGRLTSASVGGLLMTRRLSGSMAKSYNRHPVWWVLPRYAACIIGMSEFAVLIDPRVRPVSYGLAHVDFYTVQTG